MNTSLNERIAYSPAELCKVAGISLSRLYKCWREGNGPKYARIGARRLISRVEAERWIANLTKAAA